jgi:hypothetical protein
MDMYMLHEINELRIDHGLQPLAFQRDIWEAANAHTRYILDSDTFVHSWPVDDIKAWGFPFKDGNGDHMYSWGFWQNHGWGTPFAQNANGIFTNVEKQAAVDNHVLSYETSPPHLAALLIPEVELFGSSMLWGNFNGLNVWASTQDFGYQERDPYLLGFVSVDKDKDHSYDIGEGKSNIPVKIVARDGTTVKTTTDANGYYGVELHSGTYKVWVGNTSGDAANRPPDKIVILGVKNVEFDFEYAGPT